MTCASTCKLLDGSSLRESKACTSLVAPPAKVEPLLKKEPRSPVRLCVVAGLFAQFVACGAGDAKTPTCACRDLIKAVFLLNNRPNAEKVRPLLEVVSPNAR